MKPESFDDELRRAFEPSASEVARLNAAALSIAPRKRSMGKLIPIGIVVVAALAAWQSIRFAEFDQKPSAPVSSALVGNVGSIVRVRSGDRTLLVGTGDGQVRPKVPRRLWMSTEAR